MKKIISVLIALTMMASLLTTAVFAAQTDPAQASELGQLKVCKVAGSGVPEGKLFSFRVNGESYSVPAGPPDDGYCVLAGQYPLDSQIIIEEIIPSGYYVSRIKVEPDRTVSRDIARGVVTVEIDDGVTEVTFTNKVSGPPTPTPAITSTPKSTKTATPTPSCAPNCTPTPTKTPTGRMQVCKEAEGAGVTGYFTFEFANRSRTIPVGACAGLVSVDAGTLTITEEAQAGYAVSDIYTIPADRLISKDLGGRKAIVRIVEGTTSSQTIVVFRNRAVTSVTPTRTPTQTPTVTPTGTGMPPSCPPALIVADFSTVQAGQSVEGLGVVAPYLSIDAIGTARKLAPEVLPKVYGAPNLPGSVINGGMAANGGFSDVETRDALGAHVYTFSFAQGVSVSNFSLHMLDYGDLNPTNNSNHLVTMTAYNASNAVVSQQVLDFTSVGLNSPEYGNLLVTGDAVDAQPGEPGNWTWNVSGTEIVRIVLEFGAGHDPNIAFDFLSFTTTCP